MVDSKILNKLYNILDLYIVSSRIEGGPKQLLSVFIKNSHYFHRCRSMSEILSPKSIFDMSNYDKALPDIEVAYKNSLGYNLINGQKLFRKCFLK